MTLFDHAKQAALDAACFALIVAVVVIAVSVAPLVWIIERNTMGHDPEVNK
jgi:hypothetical protein